MNARPTFPRRAAAVSFASAALAALIGIGVLGAIVGIFQRDGLPFEQLVAAEKSCGDRAYFSEREACVQAHLAAGSTERFASRETQAVR